MRHVCDDCGKRMPCPCDKPIHVEPVGGRQAKTIKTKNLLAGSPMVAHFKSESFTVGQPLGLSYRAKWAYRKQRLHGLRCLKRAIEREVLGSR